jgi:hypothetical protein
MPLPSQTYSGSQLDATSCSEFKLELANEYSLKAELSTGKQPQG